MCIRDRDYVGIHRRKDFPAKMLGILSNHFDGLTLKEVKQAAKNAYAEYDRYFEKVRQRGEEIISLSLIHIFADQIKYPLEQYKKYVLKFCFFTVQGKRLMIWNKKARPKSGSTRLQKTQIVPFPVRKGREASVLKTQTSWHRQSILWD